MTSRPHRAMSGRFCRGGWWVGMLLLLGAVQIAWATIGVSPMRLYVVAEPGGEPETVALTISNTSDQRQTVSLAAEDFLISPNGKLLLGDAIAESGLNPRKARRHAGAAYIRFTEPQIEIDARENRRITFEVALPPSAAGEYYALIFASPDTIAPQRVYGAMHDLRILFQVGVVVFITAGRREVSADQEEEVRIVPVLPPRREVKIRKLSVAFPSPEAPRQTLKLLATIENRGNVHLRPTIEAVLRRVTDRRIVERVRFRDPHLMLFPDSLRRVQGEVLSPLSPGRYTVQLTVEGEMPQVRMGRTTQFEVREPIVGAAPPVERSELLTVESARIALRGIPGQTVARTIEVRNNSDERLQVLARVVHEEDGRWLSLSPKKFLLTPGRSRAVRVRVSVEPGDIGTTRTFEVEFVPLAPDGETLDEEASTRLTVVLQIGALRRGHQR